MKTYFRSLVGPLGALLILFAAAMVSLISAFANQQAAPNFADQPVVAMPANVGFAGGYGGPKQVVVQWEKPIGQPPRWLVEKDDTTVTDKIHDVLDERFDVDFDAMELKTIMKLIAGKFKISVAMNEMALEEENISPDEPVTFEGTGVKVRNLLNHILTPLQLTYVVENEILIITSRKTSANVIRFYDLSFVFPDNGLTSDLINAIEMAVTPNDWIVAGGSSGMRTVGSMLVVTAPQDTHLKIEQFLRSVGKQNPANMKSASWELSKNPVSNEQPAAPKLTTE
jgi:hypothetical protein